MTFVVLGTWEMPFVRPLREIERAAIEGLLPGPVVVQSGKTEYTSARLELVPFFGREELERMYEQATMIICQAGVGSIMLGLRKHKKIISIARLRRYDEHIDDHQLEILELFSQIGAVLPWKGEDDLTEVLVRAQSFVPAGYQFTKEKLSRTILEYLARSVSLQ
jgi:UDP-N-acetylglucosamine transferase subunit ALG13